MILHVYNLCKLTCGASAIVKMLLWGGLKLQENRLSDKSSQPKKRNREISVTLHGKTLVSLATTFGWGRLTWGGQTSVWRCVDLNHALFEGVTAWSTTVPRINTGPGTTTVIVYSMESATVKYDNCILCVVYLLQFYPTWRFSLQWESTCLPQLHFHPAVGLSHSQHYRCLFQAKTSSAMETTRRGSLDAKRTGSLSPRCL